MYIHTYIHRYIHSHTHTHTHTRLILRCRVGGERNLDKKYENPSLATQSD